MERQREALPAERRPAGPGSREGRAEGVQDDAGPAGHLDPFDEPVGSNTLEVFVHHLRSRFGSELIRTVRGVGYRLQA